MVCSMSRRKMLRLLTVALPATLLGFKARDYFNEELVCIHVYEVTKAIPEPLLEQPGRIGRRPQSEAYFQIGLPELILCRTEMKFLDMFQYYWPVSRSEIQRLQRSITILFKKPVIHDINDFSDLQKILQKQRNARQHPKVSLAIILTMNGYTKYGCPHLVDICRGHGIDELAILKDPSQPPYLCTYPSQQKGFKRPPPYSASAFKTKSSAWG